jgi:hypothetical protein
LAENVQEEGKKCLFRYVILGYNETESNKPDPLFCLTRFINSIG